MIGKMYISKRILDSISVTIKEDKLSENDYVNFEICEKSLFRNIITISHYIKTKYYYIEKIKFNEIINCIIEEYIQLLPQLSYYKSTLINIDWFNIDLTDEIKKNNIDIHNRKIICNQEIIIIDKVLNYKGDLYSEKKETHLYEKLKCEKDNGKEFKREDLTKDILYQLCIVESEADSLIGDIFNLTKSQVKYLREKYNMKNKFLRKSVDIPENAISHFVEHGLDISKYSQTELLYIYYSTLYTHANSKNWNISNLNSYISGDIIYNQYDLDEEYSVIIDDSKHLGHKEKSEKKSSGRNINQQKNNKSKIYSGKLGEKIVYDYEKRNLKNLGLYNEANNVKMVSKTKDNEITFDGLGYDIISYNKNKEKIYIEVKCSTTNNSENVEFNISEKEVKFMNGEIENIDKKHCFIYYVYKINSKSHEAKIKIIDNETFANYKLNPVIYNVNEIYK